MLMIWDLGRQQRGIRSGVPRTQPLSLPHPSFPPSNLSNRWYFAFITTKLRIKIKLCPIRWYIFTKPHRITLPLLVLLINEKCNKTRTFLLPILPLFFFYDLVQRSLVVHCLSLVIICVIVCLSCQFFFASTATGLHTEAKVCLSRRLLFFPHTVQISHYLRFGLSENITKREHFHCQINPVFERPVSLTLFGGQVSFPGSSVRY